jgi:hypothetical protein
VVNETVIMAGGLTVLSVASGMLGLGVAFAESDPIRTVRGSGYSLDEPTSRWRDARRAPFRRSVWRRPAIPDRRPKSISSRMTLRLDPTDPFEASNLRWCRCYVTINYQ